MVLDDLVLSVKPNSFVTLLGPSGCGKTTTLRIIGGFEKPDSGRVIFDEDLGYRGAGIAQGPVVDSPDGRWWALWMNMSCPSMSCKTSRESVRTA